MDDIVCDFKIVNDLCYGLMYKGELGLLEVFCRELGN